MPSEDTLKHALAAVAGSREAYRSAVVTTVGQVEQLLTDQTLEPDERSRRVADELGQFAAGRIDASAFAELFSADGSLDEGSTDRIRRALTTLRGLLERGDDLFVVDVPEDGDLHEAVAHALGEAGRAFGAARTAELTRTGRYDAAVHAGWVEHFPPRLWNRMERDLAPPLVVRVAGRDLRAGGLAEFLDGAQKLVLIVDEQAPPAALVRLITPGVLVIQTTDPGKLDELGETEGPAVAAIVPETVGRFVHRPGDGPLRDRLTVSHVPDEAPTRSLGSLTAFMQAEELRQLALLTDSAAAPAVAMESSSPDAAAAGSAATGTAGPAVQTPPAAPTVPTAPTDADILAAWILQQADAPSA
jgi:hypothetical protein